MIGVEPFWGRRLVPLVVGDGGVTHDKGVDAQVEGRLVGRVVRSKRVEHELVVGRSVGSRARQLQTGSQQLCRRDRDAPKGKRGQVDLGRQPRHLDHRVPLLVEYGYVVENQAVQEPQVHPSDAHLRAQLLTQHVGHLAASPVLNGGQPQSNHQQSNECKESPHQPADQFPNRFHHTFSVAKVRNNLDTQKESHKQS